MKFILTILLTIVLGFIAGKFLPWWSIAVVAFLVPLFLPQALWKSFLSGFLGIFILWALIALWFDIRNDGLLASRVATLFSLDGSSTLMILVTALLGGIVGGFAAMAGSSLRPIHK